MGDWEFILIDQSQNLKSLWQREIFWQDKLQTFIPLGLNEKEVTFEYGWFWFLELLFTIYVMYRRSFLFLYIFHFFLFHTWGMVFAPYLCTLLFSFIFLTRNDIHLWTPKQSFRSFYSIFTRYVFPCGFFFTKLHTCVSFTSFEIAVKHIIWFGKC